MATILSMAITLQPLGLALASVEGDISIDEMRDEKRVALVIGNQDYAFAPLQNPLNDARAVSTVLEGLGFKVIRRENATQREMKIAALEFYDELKAGGVGLFYYAGHAVQVGGRNYLIPTDAQARSERMVDVESVDLGYVLAQMEDAKNRVNFVILDACRDNPFASSSRSLGKGLASVDAAQGTLISFATSPGSVAYDGAASNSTYTSALLKHIDEPGITVETLFKRVRKDVSEATEGAQTPWESSSLIGDFYFKPPNPDDLPSDVVMLEINLWSSIKDSREPADFESYLEKYPNGFFVDVAEQILTNLRSIEQAKAAEREMRAETEREIEKNALDLRNQEQQRRQTEAVEWARARDSDDRAALMAYIAGFPDGGHVVEARGRIDALERLEAERAAEAARKAEAERRAREELAEFTAWERAWTSVDETPLHEYLAAYPEGRFAEAARERMAELSRLAAAEAREAERRAAEERLARLAAEELAFWERVKGSDDRQDLLSYLNAYPQGRYVDQAAVAIGALERREEEAALAAARRHEAARAARVAAAARAEWEALAGSSDRARVAEFLAAYPDGELAEAARLKIAELDRVEEERAAEAARLAATRARAAELQSSAEAAERTLWDQVARSDDRAELLRYVAAYPAGRYIEQANARLLEIDGTEAARVAAAAAKAQEARRAREQAEETARWESARADGSRASVLGYLKEYPEGRFAKDARVKLDEIARIEDAAAAEAAKRADAERRTRVAALEDAAWKKVAGTDDVAKLKAFLSSYPDGTKAADAKREIARLESAERDKLVAAGRKAEEQRLARTRAEEDAAWRRADDAGTTAGLKEYLATWADGQYAEQARERLDQLARAEAERAAEIARQEEERQQAEAERLAAAQSKAEQQAAELAAWDAVKDGDDVAALDSFLAKYPDGRFASIARQTVESLRKIEESKEDAARMLTQNQRHRRR